MEKLIDWSKNVMQGATKEELKILTPDLVMDEKMTKWVGLTSMQRVEQLRANAAPTWEIEYWEDLI